LLAAFYRNQRGILASLEVILMATIVIIGVVVGLATYRDAVVQELGDTSAAVAEHSQAYEYNAVEQMGAIDNMSFDYEISGASYVDTLNVGQAAHPDPPGLPPMGIMVQEPPMDEQ
jgi:hypothetical protein